MIASVSGRVLHKALEHVVVEAAGVGYRLSVSGHTLDAVPPVGADVTLLAELVVREDAMQLYGFATAGERQVFGLLTSVNGVGPKVALAVLSAMPVSEVETSLAAGDAVRFQQVPGIGKRTAERLIVELKDKVVPSGEPVVIRGSAPSEPLALAREGLLGLGYNPAEADAMLARAEGETPEQLISAALRNAAVGGAA